MHMGTNLNEMQKKAVSHKEGPMYVLAGPGSGKTSVIVERVRFLTEQCGLEPKHILVLTFAKRAAVEMKKRYLAMYSGSHTSVTFSTFHAMFFRILREDCGYELEQLLAEEERWNVIRRLIGEWELAAEDTDELAKAFSDQLSVAKNSLYALESFQPRGIGQQDFHLLRKKYEAYKAHSGKIDFDDMLTECYALFCNDRNALEKWRQRYSYLLVDEFQDVNCVQYEVLRMLAAPKNNLFVVGDDDQSIYGFRGASPKFLLQFPKDFPEAKKVVLDKNYRSVDRIVKISGRLIAFNKNRFAKTFVSVQGKGGKAVFFQAPNTRMEAAGLAEKVKKLREKQVPFREMAVLLRTNTQASQFARAFLDAGIPYELREGGQNLYEHWITKDICAYLNLARKEQDTDSLLRIINKPKRYISKEILAAAKKGGGNLFSNLLYRSDLKKWQILPLEELREHLPQIRRRRPYDAVRYIRRVVGYDEYLEQYAQYRRASLPGLKEIADEITEALEELEDISAVSDYFAELSQVFEANKKLKKTENREAVTIATIHSVKGMEFEAVFLPSVVEGLLPYEKEGAETDIEEERRLFYVGITRARSYLYLSENGKRYDRETERSRFLKEIGLGERKK